MSIFDDELRRLMKEGCDPEEAARRTIEWAERGLLAEYVLPYVAARAQHWKRQDARRAENRALGGAAPHLVREVGHVLFSVGGERVAWRDATAPQHRARALWQRTQAGALIEDAERHDRAAELIDARGVICLGELPESDWSDLVAASAPVTEDGVAGARSDLSSDDAFDDAVAEGSSGSRRRTARKSAA